jgi:hypothetical protein
MVTERELFGSAAHCYSLHLKFSLLLLDEERNLEMKVGYTRRIALLLSGCYIKRSDKLRKKYAIFIHELQNALRLALVFTYVYCEL